MTNRSPKILWPIDYSSMTSITHWCNWLPIDVIDYSSMTHRLLIDYYTAHKRHISCFLVPFFFIGDFFICVRRIFLYNWRSCWRNYTFTKGNERLHQLQISTRTKFSHLQKMALEALFKESRYPSQGVIEEFAKLNNLDGATVKVWFNNKRQRDTGEQNTNENRPSDA